MHSISPKTIKAIARTLRSQETNKLGVALPLTTLHNTLTAGLGLAQNFAAYVNAETKLEQPVKMIDPVAKPLDQGATLTVILEAIEELDDDERRELEATLQDNLLDHYEVEFAKPTHDLQCVHLRYSTATGSREHRLETLMAETQFVLIDLDVLAAQGQIAPIDWMFSDIPDGVPDLAVDLVLRDSDTTMTLPLCGHVETQIRACGKSLEEAFLATCPDLDPELTADDIDILAIYEVAAPELTNWNIEEIATIRDMARKQGLSVAQLTRQAMRLYQHHQARLEAGETVHYSGDAERARAFKGS